MGKEIERKFLVLNREFKNLAKPVRLYQAFLSTDKERVVRIRIIGEKGLLTIKGLTQNASRPEYEYEIPQKDAIEMLHNLCIQPIIEKDRYSIQINDLIWEIDVFKNENEGLVIAEIELESEDQPFVKPQWIGKEVTSDPKYYNAMLVKAPYNSWKSKC